MKTQRIRTTSQIVFFILLTFGAAGVRAGNDTWNGGGGDNNWGTAGNWAAGSANIPPVSGDELFFDGVTQLTANNNYNATNNFSGLVFNVTAGAFTLTGNSFSNNAAIIDNSPNLETINLSPVFPGTHSVTAASGASLLIGGVISGVGGITTAGAGTVTLTNNNTFTGVTTANAGTLTLDFNAAGAPANIISSSSALVVGGGTLNIKGNAASASSQTFAGYTVNPGNSVITAAPASGVNIPTVTLGAIANASPGPGATIEFVGALTTNNSAVVPATATITTTSAGGGTLGAINALGNGKNGSFATVGLYDWPSTDTGAGGAGTSPYTIIGGSQVAGFYQRTGVTTAGNYDVNSAGVNSLGNAGGAGTIRFNTPSALTVTFTASTAQNMQGFLVTPNCGANNETLAGGSGDGIEFIRATSGGLCFGVFWQNNTLGYFNVNCALEGGRQAGQDNGLVQAGPGTVAYLQPNNYELGSFLNGGCALVTIDQNFGVLANASTVTLNGGTVVGNATFTMDNAGANKRPFAIGNGGGFAATATKTMTIDGVVSNALNGAGTLSIGIPASSANGNVLGLVPGSGPGTANTTSLYATGTVAMTGANTYTGGTILQSGTLQINGINALGGANYGGVTFNGGTLQYAPAFTGNGSGDLTSIGTAGVTVASGGGTIDLNGNSVTYAGSIGNGGSGTLNVLSSLANGALTLQGAGTYTGGTTVQNATLLVNNTTGSATGTGSVTVNSGGILSGTGSIAGSVTLNTGGQIAPIGSTGLMTFGSNLTLSGGTVTISVNAATPANGIIIAGGNLTISSGTVQLAITGGTLANGTYKVIGVPSGTISGSGSLLVVSGFAQTGQDASMVANSHELDLVVTTYVPKNLLWVGDGSGSGLWNINSDADWKNTATSLASVFNTSDNTTLDDTSANQTVNLVGGLSPGSVTVNGTKSYTLAGTGKISGTAALTNNNTGTLLVLTTNDYSGGTLISSGTVQVGNGTTAGGEIGTGPVKDNAALVYDLPVGSQPVGAVSGSGTLTTTGAGTVMLNGADTLAGATTITTGTIKQGAANVLPNGAGVGDTTVNGTLDLSGVNGAVNGLFGAGTINNSAATAGTLTVYGSSASNPSLFSGLIENTFGGLTLNFDGIYGSELQLTANNTYSGGTTVTAGTLQLGDTNAISGGSLNVATGALLDLNGFSPTIDAVNGGGTIDDVSAGGTITLTIGNNGGSGTFSGAINNSSGTVNLAKNGAGTEILSGNNGYAGTTTVSGGTLQLGAGGVIASTGVFVPSSAATAGTLIVNGGTLTASAASSIGTANLYTGFFSLVAGSASFNAGLTAADQDAQFISISGGTFSATDVNLNRTAAFSTAPTAAAPVAAATTTGLYINGALASVTMGTLEIGDGNSSASARVDAGTVSASGQVQVSRISGGSGRWSILQINGGYFVASDTTAGIVIAQNNGTACNGEVYLSGGTTHAGRIGFGASTDANGGDGWLFVTNASLYLGSGGIVMANTKGFLATIELTAGVLGADTAWASSLPMNLNGTSFTIQTADTNGNPNNISLSGVLSETASSSLIVDGGGVLALSGANQYNGGTTVSNTTLNINGINALGGANYGGLTLSNNATLQYSTNSTGNGSTDLSSINGHGIWLTASGNENIDVNGNAVTYANTNALFGGGQLYLETTIPGGSLTLTSTNSYTAGTIVQVGATLYVDNSNILGTATGSGGVTVASGGTLAGNGTIGGSVEITAGGTNSPGHNGVGTNYMASLQLDGTSVNKFEFTSQANDQTVVTGSGGFDVNEPFDTGSFDGNAVVFYLYQAGSTAPWTTPGTYKLIKFTGTAPSLGTSWGTVSTSNSHVGNPQPSCLYSFALSGGYLTVTITSSGLFTAATWTNNADSTWTVAGNWSPNSVPHAAGDSATLGSSTAFRTVTLNASESVGTVSFNNVNSFDIASAGHTLTLDNSGSGSSVYVSGGTANNIQTAVALNDNTAVNVTGGDALTVSGSVANGPSGTKTLAVTGTGTLALSSANTYGPSAGSFGTTLSGPTVQVANNSALAAGDVSVTGNSTLQAGAAGLNIGNNVDIASAATVTVNSGGNTLTLGGVISDSGALTKVGAGTLVLTGNNSYSGSTTVNAGVLSLPANQGVQGTAAINLNSGELLGNGTFGETPSIGIGPLTGSTAGTGIIDAASGQVFTVFGVIGSAGNAGTNSLVINGGPGDNGMVQLNNANTYTGTTVVSNGLLDVNATLALQDSTLDYNNYGGSLVFDGSIGSSTFGGLTGTQNLALTNLTASGEILTVGNNGASTTYSGDLYDAGIGGALTKVGIGTLTLTGTNNYAGATTVNGGELQLTNNSVLDTSAANIGNAGGVEILVDGGTLVATNASTVGNPSLGLHVTSGSAAFPGGLTVASAANGTYISVLGGSLTASSLTLGRTGLSDTTQPTAGSTGDGLYISNGVVNITGNLNLGTATAVNSSANTRIDAGNLIVGGAVYIGLNNGGRWSVVDVDGGTMTVTDTVTGVSIGNAQVGDAELLVRAGTLNAGIIGLGYPGVADTAVLNQTGGSIYIGSGGIVQPSAVAGVSITLGGGLLGASTNWVNTNVVQLTGSEIIQAGDAFGNPQTISLAGPITGTGPLISSGSGTNLVSVANAYTGSTIVSNGTLAIASTGSITTSPQVAIGAGATFDVSALGGYTFTTSQTLAGNSTNGAGHIATAGNTVTLNSGSPVLLQAAGSAGGTIGKISVAGGLALNGNTITLFANSGPVGAGTYRLLDCTGTLTGTANSTPVFTGAGSNGGAASITTTAGAAGHVDLTVAKGTPAVQTLPTASSINVGSPLSASVLSGGAVTNASGTSVAGTFAFTSPSTTPPAGTANQSVTFTPTDATDYNAITMNVSVTVINPVNTNPTNITATVSNNILTLAWPADHTGWRLLVQTNHLAQGVSANTNDYMTVPGSTLVDSTNITINPTLPTEFYRLIYP